MQSSTQQIVMQMSILRTSFRTLFPDLIQPSARSPQMMTFSPEKPTHLYGSTALRHSPHRCGSSSQNSDVIMVTTLLKKILPWGSVCSNFELDFIEHSLLNSYMRNKHDPNSFLSSPYLELENSSFIQDLVHMTSLWQCPAQLLCPRALF